MVWNIPVSSLQIKFRNQSPPATLNHLCYHLIHGQVWEWTLHFEVAPTLTTVTVMIVKAYPKPMVNTGIPDMDETEDQSPTLTGPVA